MRKLVDSIKSGVASMKRTEDGKFDAHIVTFDDGTKAILKKRLHSNDIFRGIPKNTFHRREVGYYKLAQFLGFEFVPETILIKSSSSPASLQRYVHGSHADELVEDVFNRGDTKWKEKVEELATKMNGREAKEVVVLDLLVNNTDRHAKNFLVSPSKRLWAIDNSATGGRDLKRYRNVIHKYIFRDAMSLTPELEKLLKSIKLAKLQKEVGEYYPDCGAIIRRANFLLRNKGCLGFRKLSQGNYGKNDFPSYKKELMPKTERERLYYIEHSSENND